MKGLIAPVLCTIQETPDHHSEVRTKVLRAVTWSPLLPYPLFLFSFYRFA